MNKILLVLVLFTYSITSFATVISFNHWQYNSNNHIDWLITIDDETNTDYFTFNINIGVINPTGDILGFAFDSTANFNLNTDLVNYSPYNFSNFQNNSLSCGSGCNFNGATSSTFDYLFKIDQQGGANAVTEFSFGLRKNNLSLTDTLFSRVGIRAQSVGLNCSFNSCNDSVKDISSTPILITQVTEPATVLFLSFGLLSLSFRRKFTAYRVKT